MLTKILGFIEIINENKKLTDIDHLYSVQSIHVQFNIILHVFVFSGVAGCCAKSTVAPFDRVKILLQAHHTHYKHLGLLKIIITTIYGKW